MNYAVILAGGQGSRFWPLSRESFPKQFLKIIKKESLLGLSIRRAKKIISGRNIYIVSNRKYSRGLKKYLKKFKVLKENIILEPTALNTLPAIALCARFISLKDPEANLLVLPSDHYIEDESNFINVIQKALGLSRRGFLSLVGIKPDKPLTGYGYIEVDRRILNGVFRVRRFREKPSYDEARRLFRKKRIFWNSGIFCFRVKTILREIKVHRPDLYCQIVKIKTKADINKVWDKIRPISIDYAILQKSTQLAMVKGAFRWCDLGSWEALYDIVPKDSNNNVVLSKWVNLESKSTLVYSYSQKRLIATVGLRDLIIVDTPDALLVCRKDKSEEIKRLVEIIKKKRKGYV